METGDGRREGMDAGRREDDGASLFDRLGGETVVATVVDLFYDRVLADPALAGYFTGIDLTRLKEHQRRFVGQALGSEVPYAGRTMQVAHAELGINAADFDRVVDHLATSLADAGVDAPTIGTIADRLAPLKGEIVTA
jgi:hemoglobin